MSILYTAIIDDTQIIAEKSSDKKLYKSTVQEYLSKKVIPTTRVTIYEHDNFYLATSKVFDNLFIICISNIDIRTRILHSYINILVENILKQKDDKNSLSKILKNTQIPTDHYIIVMDEINVVKNIMMENITTVLNREEKLELLNEISANVSQTASEFKSTSVRLRRKLCCRRYIHTIIIIYFSLLICMIFIFVFSLSICGITFSRCIS